MIYNDEIYISGIGDIRLLHRGSLKKLLKGLFYLKPESSKKFTPVKLIVQKNKIIIEKK